MELSAKKATPLVRYAGFFLSVGTARLLGLLITLVTFPILVRRLGVETYGLWSYVVAVCAFFNVLADPGFTTHMTQQVAAHRHAAAEATADFLGLRALGVVAAVAVVLAVSSCESRTDVRWLLRCYGAGSLLVGLTASDFLLTSLELFHVRSLLSLMQQAIYAVGVLVLVRSPNEIGWLPASILGSTVITNLLGWSALWRSGFCPPLRMNLRRWKSILVPSLHYAGATMMATVYHRSGHLVVRWFLGEHALGIYSAAIRFVDILRNFVNTVFGILTPRMALAAQTRAGLRKLVEAAVTALATVAIPLVFGTVATAHLVVPWVLGANYAEAVSPVRWMAAYLLAAPLASLLSGTVLYAMGEYRAYLASAAVGAFSAVALSLTLVKGFGLMGVCAAFVFAELSVAVTACFFIPRDLRFFWRNPMIAVAAFSSLLMLSAVWIINAYDSRPLFVVASGATAYLIATALLGKKLLQRQFGVAK